MTSDTRPAAALDVVTIGEAMAMFGARETGDLDAAETVTKRIAGAERNVAIGLKVCRVSRVGDDAFGRFVHQQLEKEGVDHQRIITDKRYSTGFQLKSKVEDGSDPIVAYFRKGSTASHLSVEDVDRHYFSSARHLHLSGVAAALSASSLALLNHAAQEMHAMGKTPSFDPNLRPVLWSSAQEMTKQLNQLAAYADWVLPGKKERTILTGYRQSEAIANFCLNKSVKAVIVKTGGNGAWYKTAAGEKGQVAAMRVVNVVDTVGAGDGFAVGAIGALLEGKPLSQAIRRGNKIGALSFRSSLLPGSSNFWLSYTLLVIAGTAMYAPYGHFFAIIPEILPRNVAGGTMALINSMGALGSFVGSWFVGYLNGATGSPAASYLFMAAALLVSVFLTLIVKAAQNQRPLHRRAIRPGMPESSSVKAELIRPVVFRANPCRWSQI